MMTHTALFNYGFHTAAMIDIGKRLYNQDEVILCPEFGVYAVSDGMGGLSEGGRTSQMIREMLPGMMMQAVSGVRKDDSPDFVAECFYEQVCKLNNIINDKNEGGLANYGATLSGVWLIGNYAVFINLGDSRGYYLPAGEKNIIQITRDHNIAAILVEQGELSKEEAQNHPGSFKLTRYIGMPAPVMPEIFIREIKPGDSLLLCSDGLHGMVEDSDLQCIMRSENEPDLICKRLVDEAKANGGTDNISAVYIKIEA